MRRFWILAVTPLALLLGAAPGDDAVKDQRALQGAWAIVALEGGGKKADEDVKSMKVLFRGEAVVMMVKDEPKGRGTYTLDVSKKPKRMDLTIPKGDEKKTIKAIYELDGDTLKVCHFEGGKDGYPEKFEATKDTVLASLKREK